MIVTSLPPQGAPEGILDRCSFVRVNGKEKTPLTPEIKAQILQLVKKYGTGKSGSMTGLCVCVCG